MGTDDRYYFDWRFGMGIFILIWGFKHTRLSILKWWSPYRYGDAQTPILIWESPLRYGDSDINEYPFWYGDYYFETGYCSYAWLEDVCKVLRHNSYCKWTIGATMVWPTPASKTPWLSSVIVIVVSCCIQFNCPCHVKSMGIVLMLSGRCPESIGAPCFHVLVGCLGQHERRTPWSGGGTYKMAGIKSYTGIRYYLQRNWRGGVYRSANSIFKMKLRRHHLITYATSRC